MDTYRLNIVGYYILNINYGGEISEYCIQEKEIFGPNLKSRIYFFLFIDKYD
jgi:hypothetical protein